MVVWLCSIHMALVICYSNIHVCKFNKGFYTATTSRILKSRNNSDSQKFRGFLLCICSGIRSCRARLNCGDTSGTFGTRAKGQGRMPGILTQ